MLDASGGVAACGTWTGYIRSGLGWHADADGVAILTSFGGGLYFREAGVWGIMAGALKLPLGALHMYEWESRGTFWRRTYRRP